MSRVKMPLGMVDRRFKALSLEKGTLIPLCQKTASPGKPGQTISTRVIS